jgi:murein DD-endopeptidase MepM/ murein hydrolase activator NlpD
MGISPTEIDKVARASRKIYNLKKVRPGQKFNVFCTPENKVDSLLFFIGREQCLKIRCTADKAVAVIDTIPYTVTYHVTQGTIKHSVFASLRQQNAETELAGALDEIFGWTIDFITDIRSGDSFAILYERKTFENGKSSLGDVLAAKVVSRGEENYAFRFKPLKGSTGYYDPVGKSLQKSLRRAPLKYTRVTSNFSGRRFHPINKRYQPHYGVDYGAPRGTPIYATGDGTVLAATRRAGNGNYVKIKHNNTYTTYYLHMSRFARGIRAGVKVRQGQTIGYVGSTGSATAPHVCYRIKRNGSWVNPRKLKLPSKSPVPGTDIARFERMRDAYLLRLTESILTEPDNNTTVVERPSLPTDPRKQPVF